MQDVLEVRIAHADLLHLVEGVADIVDAAPALPDALRHQPGTAVKVELAHVRRMRRVGEEGERPHPPPGGQRGSHQARRVYAARHFPLP